MIRIIDEPVFEMTQAEYRRLYDQYWALVDDTRGAFELDFELWIEQQGWPSTVQGRIKP
jgi:hypothetical protein